MNRKLGKHYFRLILILYAAALAVCMGLRILLKLRYMELETGFYTLPVPAAATVFNIVLAVATLGLFIINRLHKADSDYPVHYNSPGTGLLCALTGAAVLLFTLMGQPYAHALEQAYSSTTILFRDGASVVLGIVGGVSLIWLGVSAFFGRVRRVIMIPVLFASIWQVFLLITRFNSYTVLTKISDNLLIVLFMVFASLFLIGQARTTFGLTRKDGRNYTIPSGLCASLTGFVLVIPNYLYMALRNAPLPVRMLGLWESLYILVLSVYALAFVIGMVRSIKTV